VGPSPTSSPRGGEPPGGEATRLREILAPFLSYVLLFTRSQSLQQRPFEEVRGELRALLVRQQDLVRQLDVPPHDYTEALFVVAAWTDELVLNAVAATNRELHQQWKRAPIQVECFHTANAGEEVFEHLAALSPQKKAVREIYYLCLCLGFRGRYYDAAQEHRLAELRTQLAADFPTPFSDPLLLERNREKITPQPYTVRPVEDRPPVWPWRLWAATATAAIVGILAIFAVFRGGPGQNGHPTPRPGPSDAEIVAAVRKHVEPLTCADVAVSSTGGIVRLDGRVENDAQRHMVQTAAQQVAGVKSVTLDGLRTVPRPFCTVLDTLAAQEKLGAQPSMDLRLELQKGCDGVYFSDDPLLFTVAAKVPLQYVYVDYYAADRATVAHIFPNPVQTDNRVDGATEVRLGAPGARPNWKVEPPFGLELVTVVASDQPLFDPAPTAPEAALTYLGKLEQALAAGTARGAAHCFINTKAK